MGQWTNFPNGICVTTATGSVAGHIQASTITVGTVSGNIIATAFECSVQPIRIPAPINRGANDAPFTVTQASAAGDSSTICKAPAKGYVEIVCVQGATAAVAHVITAYADSVTTGTAITTLSTGSLGANAIASSIGAATCVAGSYLILKHAAAGTASTCFITANIIPIA